MIDNNQPSAFSHLNDDQLNEYLDGFLEPKDVLIFEDHLKNCTDCQFRFENLQSLFVNLQSLPEIQLDRDISVSVLEVLQLEQNFPLGLKLGLLVQGILASVVLVFTVPLLLPSWKPTLNRFYGSLSEQISDSFVLWSLNLTAIIGDWQSNWFSLLTEWQFPNLVETTNFVVWPIFLMAVILFVVGNGLVLQKITRNGSN